MALKDHTAGNPQKEGVKWTDLTVYEIRQRLKEKGFDVGKRIVKKLGSTRPCVELRENQSLKKHKY